MLKSTSLLLLLGCIVFSHAVQAQSGCTDPQAINFDADALQNDGSCLYPPTSYQLNKLEDLPEVLRESSGLAYDENRLFTVNDAGNAPELFQIDSLDGKLIRSWVIQGAPNIDWEDLTQDDQYIYIGDFGNNDGNRMDLRILRIAKSRLDQDTVSVDIIYFNFSDQTNFSLNRNDNNFDCEAFFALGDSLYLFSKNWVDRKTRQYVLPITPGQHIAQLRDSFDAGGWITGAAIDKDSVIVLLGYTELSTFMWLLYDYQDTHFFGGNKRLIDLGSPVTNSQTEGIVFSGKGQGYVSSEELSYFGITVVQQLFSFSSSQWTNTVISKTKTAEHLQLKVFPSPFFEKIYLEAKNLPGIESEVFLVDLFGRIVKRVIWAGGEQEINTGDISAGAYWIIVKNEWGIYREIVIKR